MESFQCFSKILDAIEAKHIYTLVQSLMSWKLKKKKKGKGNYLCVFPILLTLIKDVLTVLNTFNKNLSFRWDSFGMQDENLFE